MSLNSLIFGLLIFVLDHGSPGASATSQIQQREEGISQNLRLYNGGGIHEYVEPFDYTSSKRDVEPPGSAYVRVGRNNQQHIASELNSGVSSDQDWGYGGIEGEGLRASRVIRPDSFIRFGRSSLKVSNHHGKANSDQIRGFERVVKSGGSKWVRVGRNVPTTVTSSEPEIAIVSPNILLERNVHCNKDLQMCYDRLAYLCSGDSSSSSCGGSGINNNNNNNNNNIANGEINEDHLHRNNFQYFDSSE